MRDRHLIEDFTHRLLHASGVLILTHQDPDFDAIGSCLAWYFQLQKHGVAAKIWVADSLYDQFSFLPGIDAVDATLPKADNFDTVLVLDASNLDRVRHFDRLQLPLEDMTVINVDHHADNSRFGQFNFVETSASSVGELSVSLFSDMGWEVDSDMATCLYSAILFDTGSFLNSNVTPDTFRVSAQLLECGADAGNVVGSMYESYTTNSYAALKVGLDRLIEKEQYAYTSLPAGVKEDSLKLIDYVRKIKGIEVAFLMKALENDRVKVSMRSKGRFSVMKFAALFGGGGHHKAAGIIMDGNLADVEAQLCERLEQVLSDTAYFV